MAPAITAAAPLVDMDDDDADVQTTLWRLPYVTAAIAIALAVAFAIELHLSFDWNGSDVPGRFSLNALGAVSRTLVESGEWWRLFTAQILHGSTEHLVGNVIVLVVAGLLLEPRLGSGWFAAIYFVGGLLGAVLSILANPADQWSVGASGAIMACVAALFTLSFHDSAKRPLLMRWVAGVLLFPALIPAITSTGALIDIYCHVGGLLVGVAISFGLMITWRDEEEPLPPGRSVATALAGSLVLLTGWAATQPAAAYQSYVAQSADYIPATELLDDFTKMQAKSYDLVRRYPKDPRSHLFRGLTLLSQRDAAAAEQQLRTALRLDQEHPGMIPEQARVLIQVVLSIDLEALGRHHEAVVALKSACGVGNLPDVLEYEIEQLHLCP